MKKNLLPIVLFMLNGMLPATALAAPAPVAKSAAVAGPTALPALSVSSGTPTSYSINYTATSAGTLYVGSAALSTGTTSVAVADIARLWFVPATSLVENTAVTFSYTATDASGTSSAVAYNLTVVRASSLDFSTRTSGEDWSSGRSVAVDNTTLTGSAYTYGTATTHTLAVGNPSNRLPGVALAWGSTYPNGSTASNTSTYTFTFSRPVSYLTLTLTDIDAGTSAADGSNFIDDVTLDAYSAASSTTAITYDKVTMATVVNAAAATSARTTSTNQVKGTANNAATANGTVIVSFTGQVQRLVITYANSSTVTGNARIQNLGIPSLNWAYAATPLPVVLTSFSATASATRSSVLTWTTASEQHNDYFEVQRSFNGVDFARIATVAGRGNSTVASAYSYTDTTVPEATGLAYYRLRQVDYDGTTSCSPVKTVSFSTATLTQASVYPNPVATATTLDLSQWATGSYQVRVYQMSGQERAVFTVQGGQSNPLDLSALASGCYLLRFDGVPGNSLRLSK